MTQNSYDLNNLIRDVAPDFDTLIAQSPSFLRLLGSAGTTFNFAGDAIVTNNKHEWINETLIQVSSDITGFATDGDGTGISLTSNAGIEIGSILRFEKATGASTTELVQVTAVNVNGTDITVTRDYGGTVGITLVIGDISILNSTPKNEDSDVGAAILQQGDAAFNYTEIFDEVANLSGTAMASATYDKAGELAKQVKAAMVRIARKLENASIYGVPVQRTALATGSMGGILSFIGAVDGNIDATGGAISQTLINNVIEDIADDGGPMSNPVLLCAPQQARKLSALNTSGTNPTVFKENTDRSLGNYTTRFVGDLPIDGSGVMAQIFVSQNMKKDQIAVLDMDRIDLAVMRGLTSKDATTNGTDGRKERLLMETTLEVRNATKAHGLITGLDL